MTREEIIDFCEMKSQLEPENEDIFNYIIKLLEQEPKTNVLDKIRAEIIEKYWDCDICKYNGHFNIRGDINDILQIIDKYKAESEDKE